MGGEGGGAGSGGGSALETTTYHWNRQGMLEKVILPSGEPVEYRYDGAGRLTGRITADGEDLFVNTGWDIVEKRSAGIDRHSQYPQGTDWQGLDSQGQGLQGQDPQGADSQGQNREGGRTYYTGLSSIKEGDKVRYYLYNHRGDTVLVTGGDGEIIHNLSYEAYGKATDKLGYPAGSVNIETGVGDGATSGGVGSSGGAGSGGSGSGESTGSGACGGGSGGSESFGGGAGDSSGGESFGGGANSSAGSSSGGRDSVFPQLFAGAYGIRYDAKTNLHYMRYRWYSQTQIRFISLDLIRNANRYSYTNGNPIMYVDPTGLKEEYIYHNNMPIKPSSWNSLAKRIGKDNMNWVLDLLSNKLHNNQNVLYDENGRIKVNLLYPSRYRGRNIKKVLTQYAISTGLGGNCDSYATNVLFETEDETSVFDQYMANNNYWVVHKEARGDDNKKLINFGHYYVIVGLVDMLKLSRRKEAKQLIKEQDVDSIWDVENEQVLRLALSLGYFTWAETGTNDSGNRIPLGGPNKAQYPMSHRRISDYFHEIGVFNIYVQERGEPPFQRLTDPCKFLKKNKVNP